jgi:hypothetical protein
MLLSRQTNARQNRIMNIDDRLIEILTEIKYLGTTVINQNVIQGKIMRKLNFGNGYHLVLNILSSPLLSKKLNIKIVQNYNFACGAVWV